MNEKMEMTGGFDGPPRGEGHLLVAPLQTRSRGEKPKLTRGQRVTGAGVSLQHWGLTPALGSVSSTRVCLQHWYMGVNANK